MSKQIGSWPNTRRNHMHSLKKIAATIALAITLAVTGGAVAQTATAAPAQAVNWTQGPIKYQWDWVRGSDGRYYCGVWAYNDYNWWEESWAGGSHRDGWEREWYALC